MCVKISCNQCGLTTWKGCGQHVAQVLRNVPISKRCKCKMNLEISSCKTNFIQFKMY
ncbi:hypothetical protein I4U23_014826 [Adineta vaga]|nr:hypothetical protein I4U23_014826 [Adineta vaga]